MIPAAELAGVLRALPRIDVAGVFWRTVMNAHLRGAPPGAPAGSTPQPLWPGGPAIRGARYTRIGGSDALYLASDAATALAEVEAVVFGPEGGVQPGPAHDPLVVFAAEVQLPAVLDLCDERVQAALGTSARELKAPWLRAQERHKGRHRSPPPRPSSSARPRPKPGRSSPCGIRPTATQAPATWSSSPTTSPRSAAASC